LKDSRNTTRSGLIAFFASSVVNKFASLFSQFALGWFLTKEDYGIYGMAISLGAMAAFFRETSVLKYLVQQGDRFAQIKDTGLLVSLLFGLGSCVVLVVGGEIYSELSGVDAIMPICVILGVGFVLGFPLPVLRASSSIKAEYAKAACRESSCHVLNQLAIIPLAVIGLGPLSFVAARPFILLLEVFLFLRAGLDVAIVGFWHRVTFSEVKAMLWSLRWLMLSALFVTFALRGDYFVLGLLVDPYVVGIYFFGYQLSAAVGNLITAAMDRILLPEFTRNVTDTSYLQRQFDFSIKLIGCIAIPICTLCAIISPIGIHILWQAKWDQAAIVTQVLLFVMSVRFINPILKSLLEARGRWHIVTLMMLAQGGGVLLASWIGGVIGSVQAIVYCIGGWQLVYTVGSLLVIPLYYIGLNCSILKLFCGICAVQVFAILTSMYIQHIFYPDAGLVLASIYSSSIYIVTVGLLAFLCYRSVYKEMFNQIRDVD
jgi:O-antigen/teichoic acid export membrane protein